MMYIGGISKLTGASPKAIRHYESLGLLGEVTRSGSYRVYSDDEVRQIKLIRLAQALGFRLSELRPFLQRAGKPDWPGLARQVGRRRAQVSEEIARLQQLDSQLAEIDACLGGAARGQAAPARARRAASPTPAA
ncbi:MerR family transcriptional regulator [Janthinobacterium fluminis]|uniref:MerR family transcriptional regulator n=1 Tax=Janthinobacterium fluminis TaxID=2987524 RepID=A0ABT5K091_9BURK|nr:MerR family transcriptional regulator [Janthinobacterium fluminis]MDC8758392.1 MerR family transcriptional regulator [Janthinobacterium fluminis]